MLTRWRAIIIGALFVSALVGALINSVSLPNRFIVADIIRILTALIVGGFILYLSKRNNVPIGERRGRNWLGWAAICFGLAASTLLFDHLKLLPDILKIIQLDGVLFIGGLLLLAFGLILKHGHVRAAPINWTVTAVDIALMVGASLLPFFMMTDWQQSVKTFSVMEISIFSGSIIALLTIMVALPLVQHRETAPTLRTPGIVLIIAVMLLLIGCDNIRWCYQFSDLSYSGLGSWMAGFLLLGISIMWELDALRKASPPELMTDVAYGLLSEILPLLAMFMAVIFVFLALTTDLQRNYQTLTVLTMLLFLSLVRRVLAYLQMRCTVDEVRAQVTEIEQAVITDNLTGLANRRFLMQRMNEELSRAKRFNRPVAVIFFDIDFFKMVNDIHGHDNGDRALCHIANILKKAIRSNDVISRLGGEEFVILLPDTNQSVATMLAERLRNLIEISTLTLSDGVELQMTISGGVAAYPETCEEVDELLKASDTAMNQAKNSGRNRIVAAPAKQRLFLKPMANE